MGFFHMGFPREAFQNAVVGVTGGAGFIGSHLVARLVEVGAREVRIVDSFEYGDASNLGPQQPNVASVVVRIGAGVRDDLVRILAGVDFLFHLAAEKHNQSIDNPPKVIDVNIAGSYEVLKAARDCGVKKVVYSSSLYAYGRMCGPPFLETETPRPETVYGISKLAGEHLCSYFQAQFGLPCVSLRYLFVYGPKQFARQGYKSVIVCNFERMLNGEAPVINGDGRQTLDYIFVDDVVELTLRAMLLPVAGNVINICTGRGISVLELTDLMQRAAGSSYQPVFAPADATHGSVRVGDPSRMRELLQYYPAVSIESGLQATLDWMKSLRSGA